jgi:iron complex transport system substrate-binding protein
MKRVVKVPTSATRIAVLAPFAADLLLDLGVKPIVVPAIRGGGPASWKDLPTVAVDHSAGPNLEQIVASKPDLIIATTVYAQFMQQIEASSKAPVIVLDVKTLDDVARHLKTLGSITGKDAAAAELIGGIERAVTEQAAANQGAASSKVLAIFGTPHAFYGFLPDSYLGDLVRRCNASLVTEGLTSHKVFQGLAPLSMEAIVAKNPEVILVVYHGPSEVATAMLAKDPAWNGLDAVVKKRVHVLNDELFVMHTGLRPAEALSQIANAIKAPAAEPSTP